MLPKASILISRIRQESDTVDDNSLSDLVILQYLNDAQRTIQNLIHQSDQLNNVFTNTAIISRVLNQVEYDLPANVYAENSLISVWTLGSDNKPGQRYDKITYGESSLAYGYSIRNRKIVFNHEPAQNVLIVYNYRLPNMQKAGGKVDTVVGQLITLDGATLDEEFTTDNFENTTIVDKYGQQIVYGLFIDSLVGLALTVEGDITSVTNAHYAVPGKNASTHSSLPEECETYLKVFVERKILAHINSKKIGNMYIFTKQEREDIVDLFADKQSDIEYPVIVDYDFMDY